MNYFDGVKKFGEDYDPWELMTRDLYHLNTNEGETELTTKRLSVPGGWIYKTMIVSESKDEISVSTVFVPFARFSGAEMEGRLATSPHSPANAPRPASAIPDFSAPAPKRRS